MFLQLIKNSLCLVLLLSGIAHAQFDEKQLQSLFMTVEQRKQVDDLRSGNGEKIINQAPVLIEKSEKITITGFVKRSNGKNVVWLNGKNTMQSDSVSDVKVQTRSINASNEVPVIIDGKRQLLKPGETWLRPSTVEAASEAP